MSLNTQYVISLKRFPIKSSLNLFIEGLIPAPSHRVHMYPLNDNGSTIYHAKTGRQVNACHDNQEALCSTYKNNTMWTRLSTLQAELKQLEWRFVKS